VWLDIVLRRVGVRLVVGSRKRRLVLGVVSTEIAKEQKLLQLFQYCSIAKEKIGDQIKFAYSTLAEVFCLI
jgi:hypothetical protein